MNIIRSRTSLLSLGQVLRRRYKISGGRSISCCRRIFLIDCSSILRTTSNCNILKIRLWISKNSLRINLVRINMISCRGKLLLISLFHPLWEVNLEEINPRRVNLFSMKKSLRNKRRRRSSLLSLLSFSKKWMRIVILDQ